MDIGWLIWGLFLFAIFLLALCLIRFSKRIVSWIFGFSIPFLKEFGEVPHSEAQYEMSIWIIRIFGFLVCCGTLAMLISGLYTNL
jgi:hypothetical protein